MKDNSQEMLHRILWDLEEKHNDIDDFVDALSDHFDNINFVDEKIDDGSDSDEDEYVMMRSYNLTFMGKKFYLRIFYGNNTMEIGSFETRED